MYFVFCAFKHKTDLLSNLNSTSSLHPGCWPNWNHLVSKVHIVSLLVWFPGIFFSFSFFFKSYLPPAPCKCHIFMDLGVIFPGGSNVFLFKRSAFFTCTSSWHTQFLFGIVIRQTYYLASLGCRPVRTSLGFNSLSVVHSRCSIPTCRIH